MENMNIINEDIAAPIKVKKPVSDAQKQANKGYYEKCKAEKGKTNASEAQMKSLKKYYDRVKGTEEYVQKIRNNSKQYYENHREAVIERIRKNQEKNKMNEMLMNLYELQKDGLINIHTQNLNADQHKKLEEKLMSRFQALGLVHS